jgi:hypothetical protein
MAKLHDATVRDAVKKRVLSLRPASSRRWGRMTVDQMLWHVNTAMAESLGEYSAAANPVPIPRWLLRWLVLNVPWPRGAKTRPDLVATAQHDFEAERARCLAFVDRVASRDLHASWPASANFGEMSGAHWSRLHAKHLDHHLRQFGV